MSNSDLDVEAYSELMKESANTGKSIQQLIEEESKQEDSNE